MLLLLQLLGAALFVAYGYRPIRRRYWHLPGLCSLCPAPPPTPSVAACAHPAPRCPLPLPSAGPPPRWLVGNLLELMRGSQVEAVERWARQYGPLWCFWSVAAGAWLACLPAAATPWPYGRMHADPSLHV